MVAKIISQDRLTKYLLASGYDTNRALELYGWNIQLSEAFFPILSAAEVSLRNLIVERLISLYGQHWWDNPAFLYQIGKGGKRNVKTAKEKLLQNGPATSGRMTAELSFGFWVKMLLPKHQQIIWTDFRSAFADIPATVTYNQLYQRCDNVREFRNRVFHHEPILHRNITSEYSKIMELVKWLSKDKADWIKKYSRVMVVVRQKP